MRAIVWSFVAAVLLSGLPRIVRAIDSGGEDEVAARWTFDTPADAEAWRPAHDCEVLGIKGGALQVRLTGPDAFLSGPPLRVRMDSSVIRVRMRCERAGRSELYYGTDKDPQISERQVIRRDTPAGRDFQTVEFALGTLGDVDRYLTALRLDPCNGNREGLVEIDSIEVVRLAPVFEVWFAPADARIRQDEVALKVRARQTAGRWADQDVRIAIGDEPAKAYSAPRPGAEVTHERTLRVAEPGVHVFTADVRVPGRRFLLATAAVSKEAAGLGDQSTVGGGRLVSIRNAGGEDVGAIRVLASREGENWQEAAILCPLATITVRTGALIERRVFHLARGSAASGPSGGGFSAGTARLTGRVTAGGADWAATLTVTEPKPARTARRPGEVLLAIETTLSGPPDVDVLGFSGPTVLVDSAGRPTRDRFGLFGGIEFLEPGWESSSARAVGETFAARWTPHPFKVTLPLMAIEQAGLATAVMWDPLQDCGGGQSMPAATFATPNFIDGQPNHRMQLSLPSVGSLRRENEEIAAAPLRLEAGKPLRISFVLAAEKGRSVVDMARRWYEVFGVPEPPPAPHSPEKQYEICVRNYGETMFWPEDKGWRAHWYLDKTSQFAGHMAAELVSYAARTGERRYAEATGVEGKTIIDLLGPLASRLDSDPHVRSLISSQRPDGHWPFHQSEDATQLVRHITRGRQSRLGEEGALSLGTTVQAALPILHHALLTGDAECVTAGLKALAAMREFRVPRGAQVWEVHQEIPDIRAAALAIEAFRIGYQITGDEKYLDDAQYWAWTGVPFLYAWKVPLERSGPIQVHAARDKKDFSDRRMRPAAECFENPDRQIMPYATIPVLGTTCYEISWFGNIVQWCGLEWAYQTLDLLEFRADPILRTIALGVMRSGQQQQLDRPPWVGLYPDVWQTETNHAVGAFISAMMPLRCLRSAGECPADTSTWTRVIETPRGRIHVSGWGRPRRVEWLREGLAVRADFAPQQPSELVIVGAGRPGKVLVAGAPLAEGSGQDHWQYRADRRAVIARFTHKEAVCPIEVEWASASE